MRFVFFSFILFLILPTVSFSQNHCAAVFQEQKPILSELKSIQGIAAGEVSIANKRIPVVLANAENIASLKVILQKTLGIVIAHQKGYRNDHGLFRLGDYFIDRDIPGYRRDGELNTTGISWAKVNDYVQYQHGREGGYNRIEVVFDLSLAEFETAMIYQKMRQAAVVRPDFNFGGDYNPKDVNNRLTDCGEICFSFSTGSAVEAQVRSIRKKLQELGIADLDQVFLDQQFQAYLYQIKQYLFKSSLSQKKLNPDVVNLFKIPEIMRKMKFEKKVQTEVLNWLVGFKISEEYAGLLSTLNIRNSSDYSNVQSNRASAVFVYDGVTSKEHFLNSDYFSEGIFSTWRNTDFTPFQ